jgi:acetyltransferase EpsM
VADILRSQGGWRLVGFLDDIHPERRGHTYCGAAILGGEEAADRLRRDGVEHAIVAIGDAPARIRLGDSLRARGFSLASAVHAAAVIAPGASLGANTVVAAAAVIGTETRVGAHVIVNTGATIDHHCLVEDGAHVCPGVHVGGGTTIEAGAWIGIGATVIDGVTVGAHTVVGAGAVVVRSLPAGVVAYGCPARVVRAR